MSLPMSWMSPLDRADDDRALRASCVRPASLRQHFLRDGLHDLAAHDQLGDERLTFGVAATDRLHRLAASLAMMASGSVPSATIRLASVSASSMRRPTIASFNS